LSILEQKKHHNPYSRYSKTQSNENIRYPINAYWLRPHSFYSIYIFSPKKK